MLTFFTRRSVAALPPSPPIPHAAEGDARHVREPAGSLAARGAGRVRPRPPCEPGLVYPPADPGLPAVAVSDIVSAQAPLIARLRSAVGGDDPAFARLHLAPIEALARYVHLLPASAHAHFAGAGGLFRQCLECAFFSAQAAGGRVFASAGPAERRHALEPRWRHAAFLAGLTCELRGPLGDAVVCDDTGREWPKFLGGLDAWIDDLSLARFHVNWLPSSGAAGHAEAAAVVGRILPPASLAWLSEGAPEITRALFAVSLGQPEASDSPLGELLEAVRREVLRGEAARRPSRYGLLRVGHHLERHLVDAIRARIECGDWHPRGEAEAMLSWRDGALHLRWPDAASTIVADLVARGLPGIPRSSGTLLECLATAGLLAPPPEGGWLWPAAQAQACPVEAGARSLRFADAGALLPAFHAAPSVLDLASSPAPAPPEATLLPLSSDEVRCVRAWQAAVAARAEADVLRLPDGRVALSHALVSATHPDVPALLRSFDRHGWLARGDWPARRARIGLVAFAGGSRPGVVLTAPAARLLGLAP